MGKAKVYTRLTQKKCTKLLLSPDNFNFIPSAKWKIVPFMAPPINHQNTQNKRKLYYGFVQGPLQFQSTRQNPCTADLKNSNLAMLAFKKKTKTEQSFRKLNSPPTKLCMFFSLTSKPGSCPQTYSLSLSPEWSQVTHVFASTITSRAYKTKKSPSSVP